MTSVARDPGPLRSGPIFVESEEEIPAVIERLTQAEADEVPLVLPARSRFAQSRFNFQLLRDYSSRLGKRVVIISPDPAVQRMAEENGFTSHRAVDQYQAVARGPAAPPPAPHVVPVPQPPPAAQPERSPPPADARIAAPDERTASGPPQGQRVPGVPQLPRVVGVPSVTPLPAAGAGAAGGAGSAAAGEAGAQAPLAAAPVRSSQDAPVRITPKSRTGDAARRPTRIKVSAPRPLPSRLASRAPSRLLLYGGAILILLVGMVAMAVYVPSAKVTLVTEASPFNADLQVSAEPNKAPIKVRTSTVGKEATLTQKATGVKTIPGALASGTVSYANNCPTGFIIPDGQVLVGAGGGVFAQKGAVTIGPKGLIGPPAAAAAPIVAKSPGAAGNLPGGPAALQPAGDAGSCLVAVISATAGGSDEQKKTVVSSADYDTAKAALEGQVRKQAIEDLSKQLQNGEKLADPPVTIDSAFKATKRVDEEAADFQATLTVKIEGALYVADDVNRAFGDAIQRQLPAGQQLTGNRARVDYGVTSTSAGGHLTFKGRASGYEAPRLDLQKVKSQLPGKSTSKVRGDLARLPGVRSVQIDQSPVKLPIMPLSGSRIDLQYVVSQAPPTRSG